MIVATQTKGTETTALAILAGREIEIWVFAATTYDSPNTWGMVINDLETGAQRMASFPKGEDWTASRFYNITLWGENGRLGHPRSLDDLVQVAFSPAAERPAQSRRSR